MALNLSTAVRNPSLPMTCPRYSIEELIMTLVLAQQNTTLTQALEYLLKVG